MWRDLWRRFDRSTATAHFNIAWGLVLFGIGVAYVASGIVEGDTFDRAFGVVMLVLGALRVADGFTEGYGR